MDITTIFSAFMDLGARWVLWMLIGLSVAGLAVILERLFFFASTREDLAGLRAETADLLSRHGPAAVVRRLEEKPSTEARLAAAVFTGEPLDPGPHPDRFRASLERLTTARALERMRLERGLSFLGTLAAAAPFVGLLGTVIGIVAAFHQLAASQGRLTGALMNEIGEALVATAVGLLVALPALAAFNALQRMIHVRLTRGEAFAREAMLRVSATPAEGGDA